MEVIVKNAALVSILEEIASAYRDLYPERFDAFLKILNEENKSLLKPTALSTEGTMLSHFMIPSEIYTFIKWQMQKRAGLKDFFSEESNYRLLTKVWSAFRVKREGSVLLHPSSSNPLGSASKGAH